MLLNYSDPVSRLIFFFNDTATTEIYTLSLHDALPICERQAVRADAPALPRPHLPDKDAFDIRIAERQQRVFVWQRSEEHTSELQSRPHLVCRLLLEYKNS